MGMPGDARKDRYAKPRNSSQSAIVGSEKAQKPAPVATAATTMVKDGAVAEKEAGPVKLRLFVGGLGVTVNPSDLQQRFAPLGRVHAIQMVESKNGEDEVHRGFAYVEFEASSDASLRKLFSAYNGCKWKGGVLRVEKAKEHYTDRLSREWAEAAVKAASAENSSQLPPGTLGNAADNLPKGLANQNIPFLLTEPLKIPVPFSKKVRLVPPKGTGRHKRSFQYFPSLPVDELTRESSPPRPAKRTKPTHSAEAVQDSGTAKDESMDDDGGEDEEVDEIAAEVAKERKRQLDLISRLFPDDNNDAGEEEVKGVEVPPVPSSPETSDSGAEKRSTRNRKPPSGKPPPASREPPSVRPGKGASRASEATAGSESGPGDEEESPGPTTKQKTVKSLRVTFSEDAPAAPSAGSEKDGGAGRAHQRGESVEGVEGNAGTRPILKKAGKELAAVEETEYEDEDEDEDEPMEEEYYTSSRSPSLEGEGTTESQWERLFKHASVKKGKGADAPKPADGLFTGISLDDEEEEEPAAPAVAQAPKQEAMFQAAAAGVTSGGAFSGVLDEPETEMTVPPPKTAPAHRGADGGAKKKETRASARAKIALEEEIPSALGDGKAVLDITMEEDTSELSSGYEDADEDLGGTEDEDEDEDDDEPRDPETEEDSDPSTDEYEDANAEPLGAASPSPLNAAAQASKWEQMFRSAASVAAAGPQGAVFSGSLDEPEEVKVKDVPARARPSATRNRMFEVAAAAAVLEPASAVKAPSVSNKTEMVIAEKSRSPVEKGGTKVATSSSSEGDEAAAADVNEKSDGRIKDEGGDGIDGAGDLQKEGDNVGGNLLARFDMEQDEPGPAPRGGEGGEGEASTVPPPAADATKGFDENSKWLQRASWKSLVGPDGRAAFSLKALTGEAANDPRKKKAAKAEPPARPFAFNFNFARAEPDALRAPPARPRPAAVAEKAAPPPAPVAEEKAPGGVDGCRFMKLASAEREWRESRSEIRMDSKAKHKAAVRTMKKMRSSGGAR